MLCLCTQDRLSLRYESDDCKERSSPERQRQTQSSSSQIGGCLARCRHSFFDWWRLRCGGLRRRIAPDQRLRFVSATATCRSGSPGVQACGVQDGKNISTLARQSRTRPGLYRSDFSRRQWIVRSRRFMVRASARQRVPRHASEALCARGNDLDESVHYGARTVRWRRHCSHSSELREETRLASSGSPLWSGLACAPQSFGVVWLHLSGRTRQNSQRNYGRSDCAVAKRAWHGGNYPDL